jgi:hypothetical protein
MVYFPGRYYPNFYGGAEVLILNLIRRWRKSGMRVGLVGIEEYSIIPMLRAEMLDIDFIPIDRLAERTFSEDDLLIIFVETYDLYRIKGNPLVLIWNIMSYSLVQNTKGGIKRPLALAKSLLVIGHYRRMLKKFHRSGSLFFMDGNCAEVVMQRYGFRFEPRYIPIPVEEGELKYVARDLVGKKTIVATFLGRGDEAWKALCATKLFADLRASGRRIELHVITNKKELFEEGFAKCGDASKITVRFHFGLKERTLWDFLVEKADIHFAMGTSALEAAKFGIPTILMDYSKKDFPEDYRYRWLFQSERYTLGDDIEHHPFKGRVAIENILGMDERENGEISRHCHEYVRTNHSMRVVSDALLGARPQARLREFLLPRYLRITRKNFPFLKQLSEIESSEP